MLHCQHQATGSFDDMDHGPDDYKTSSVAEYCSLADKTRLTRCGFPFVEFFYSTIRVDRKLAGDIGRCL